MPIATIHQPIALGVAALALSSGLTPLASARPVRATPVPPTVVEYHYGVRQIHTHDGRCTARLDAKRTAPGHWFVRASFSNVSGQGCSYRLWRRTGNGAYGMLSHGRLGRHRTHRTAWYEDGPRYRAMTTVDDGDGWGGAHSEPY
ncbi:hypothetical protein [Streptomyces cyanogenus]|uniref:Secreted protein n=1 Tax=Streptomyces cyanogenus TaxID=80860 RepID=A0ABX7U1G1_STRCY|nr:hypothetical protein [Streptomyces cyanogenus]QTE02866.1 hypothetical protein S1361_36370 [Streptomyces cyanogenus]